MVHIEQAGDLLLLQSGIGKANAAAACALLFQLFKPAALLNIGSAGGFAHDLHFGDVVVATELLYSDADATCFNYRLGQVPQMPPTYPTLSYWPPLRPQPSCPVLPATSALAKCSPPIAL